METRVRINILRALTILLQSTVDTDSKHQYNYICTYTDLLRPACRRNIYGRENKRSDFDMTRCECVLIRTGECGGTVSGMSGSGCNSSFMVLDPPAQLQCRNGKQQTARTLEKSSFLLQRVTNAAVKMLFTFCAYP